MRKEQKRIVSERGDADGEKSTRSTLVSMANGSSYWSNSYFFIGKESWRTSKDPASVCEPKLNDTIPGLAALFVLGKVALRKFVEEQGLDAIW